jgi:AraC-like DNA-binding protein
MRHALTRSSRPWTAPGGHGAAQEIIPAEKVPPRLSSIYIKRSGWLRRSAGFHHTKFNREYNLHFVREGRGIVRVDDVELEMKAGDVFMFFPGHRSEHYDLPGERWNYHWVALGAPDGLEDALADAIAATGLTEGSPARRLAWESPLWNYVAQLHELLRKGGYGSLLAVSAAWRILEALEPAGEIPSDSLAERIRNFVDGVDGAIEVKELALRFGISRSTAHRVFSETLGSSLKDYMQERRFESACGLLEGSAIEIKKVASAAGFASAQYFCRAFKNRYGKSPGVWRKDASVRD